MINTHEQFYSNDTIGNAGVATARTTDALQFRSNIYGDQYGTNKSNPWNLVQPPLKPLSKHYLG